MDKKQNYFSKFINWIIGNTAWDYFKRFVSLVFSTITSKTFWESFRPNVSEWLTSMNIPLIVAIVVMFIGLFVIAWGILSFIYNLYKKLFVKRTSNELSHPHYSIRKEGYEVYIDVKNRKWFVDISRTRLVFNYLNADNELISDTLEWIQNSNKNGETYIGRRKTKTIHFATINQLQQTYDIHLSKTMLNNPFKNDRAIPIAVEGLTSSGAKKYFKKDINGTLLLLEVVSKGILNFEIGTYHKMGAV